MSRLPGKKIDRWEWSKDRQVFKVDVRMDVDRHKGGMQFGVVVPELDINLWNKDIDALKREVFEQLDQKVNMNWEPYLHIEVSGDTQILKLNPKRDADDYDDELDNTQRKKLSLQEIRESSKKSREAAFALSVKVESYELTTTPAGQKLSRRIEEYRTSTHTSEGWPEVGIKEPDRDYGETKIAVASLVPDTPENREALNSLSRELQRLIDRLVEICTPEVIEKTLVGAIGTRLLAAKNPTRRGPRNRRGQRL